MNQYGSLRKSQFKSISSRLAVKSLFNSKFDFESTAPDKTDPTRFEVLKSTQVDLLGSTPRARLITFAISGGSRNLSEDWVLHVADPLSAGGQFNVFQYATLILFIEWGAKVY